MTARSRTQTPRKLSLVCTASGVSTCSTDYLVICGRASACPMYAASATIESPLDSSEAHHRSTPLPCATLLAQLGARPLSFTPSIEGRSQIRRDLSSSFVSSRTKQLLASRHRRLSHGGIHRRHRHLGSR